MIRPMPFALGFVLEALIKVTTIHSAMKMFTKY